MLEIALNPKVISNNNEKWNLCICSAGYSFFFFISMPRWIFRVLMCIIDTSWPRIIFRIFISSSLPSAFLLLSLLFSSLSLLHFPSPSTAGSISLVCFLYLVSLNHFLSSSSPKTREINTNNIGFDFCTRARVLLVRIFMRNRYLSNEIRLIH